VVNSEHVERPAQFDGSDKSLDSCHQDEEHQESPNCISNSREEVQRGVDAQVSSSRTFRFQPWER